MRYLAAAVVLALCSCQSVRDLPRDEQRVEVVHEAPGLSRDDIMARAQVWFAKAFVDSKAVVRLSDKAAGDIVGKGVITGAIHLASNPFHNFDMGVTMSLEAKDGKYRTTFEDFTTHYDGGVRDCYVGSELDSAKAAAHRLDGEIATAITAKPRDF